MLPTQEFGTRFKTFVATFWQTKNNKATQKSRRIYCPHTVPCVAACCWHSISCNPIWIFPGKHGSRLWRAPWKAPPGYIPNGKYIEQQREPKYFGWLLLGAFKGDTNRKIQETKNDKM